MSKESTTTRQVVRSMKDALLIVYGLHQKHPFLQMFRKCGHKRLPCRPWAAASAIRGKHPISVLWRGLGDLVQLPSIFPCGRSSRSRI